MQLVFRDDAYVRSCAATVTAVDERGIRLDATVFYPTGGGQPGDTGILRLADGREIAIVDSLKGASPDEVIHVPAPGAVLPEPGTAVTAEIDWARRHRLMRMHSCLHLLCAVIPGEVSGGQVADGKGRLDFNIPDAKLDKDQIEADLNRLITEDHAVSQRWIADEELTARPELVRTMSVKPPVGQGRVRLLEIEGVDLQPCGGTHIARTGEIGPVQVVKIESKGKQNRRVNIALKESLMADYAHPESLVSTAWLAQHLADPDLRVVDASYYLPMQNRSARAEYDKQHIPGAVFFDVDEIADTDSPLPHMLPSPEKFASRVRKLGLGDGNRIVVYDSQGLFSAARVWWSFRVFGHKDVAVLDGGLPKWLAEGRPVDDLPPQPRERHFTARFDHGQVRNKGQMLANMASKRGQVLDARAAGRFHAREPEVWPGRRSGHIPGSHNLPFTDLLNPADKTLLPAEQLMAKFRGTGIDLAKPVIVSCGSGMTAAVLALGLHLIGHRDVALYDGSWAEWGLPGDTPVEPKPSEPTSAES